MNLINKHLDKNNFHHSYLIEGARDEIIPELLEFIEEMGVKVIGNPDFVHISIDSFKIEDARNLKSYATEKSFSSDLSAQAGKKIFIISANNFLLEAQNSLLKMFEEPIENTHFFLIVPDINALLKTLVSRFYLISARQGLAEEVKDAERFISLSLQKRIDFIKELLPKKDTENEEEINAESNNSKALKFINALEGVLHSKLVKNFSGLTLPGVPGGTHTVQNSLQVCLQHFLKVRKFLRMPGSSVKTLMESVALVIPEKVY
ncbi:MAG: polymerase III subunit delta protein [Parcubacteria group bacterium GW2011_GWB1_36_5]|nr:MAG: polymerase III subunit delta protein [Parcubacteria group bacterium GW2011_GWA2_36_24]KKQ07735.1 MAG: polymerase III subunit delta protein [Parcubacteria group bacterium GW2011_GWB1_36_5]